jgi:hypothetical protein
MPWYPSARLIRQAESGQWQGVMGQVVEQAARLAQTTHPQRG